jgi:hypothetical protein
MYSKEFYQDLLCLAKEDLSKAHLQQHFTTALSYISAFGWSADGQATWSAIKPQDTLIYDNGTVTGKKYWISGVDLCDWVVVPAKDVNTLLLVLINKKDLIINSRPTLGMERTLTGHFICEQAPVRILGNRGDPRAHSTDHGHRWCFITNHLGLALAAFQDIDVYTKNLTKFDYNKDKIKLDLEILSVLWNNELDNIGSQTWERNDLVYAFAKKVLTQVTHLVTELTGSGIYEINHPSHQRFKDLLIYTTHMRNTATAIKDINWSF